MLTVLQSEPTKETGLDAQIFQDVLSKLAQIGAREALSLKTNVGDKKYVLQFMPQGMDRCVLTAFEEGTSVLSFQFAINVDDGKYIYGAPDAENVELLRILLDSIKDDAARLSSSTTVLLPPLRASVGQRIADSLHWLRPFLEDLAILPEEGEGMHKPGRKPIPMPRDSE